MVLSDKLRFNFEGKLVDIYKVVAKGFTYSKLPVSQINWKQGY